MSEPVIDFEQFFAYEVLCEHIRSLAEWKPALAQVRVIGHSREGRDILLLEITDSRTGRPEDKPAYLVHGNIHAPEVSGATCALYLAHYLLANAESDPIAGSLLDRIAFQICPRICVDGAEEALVRQCWVRSRQEVEKRKNCIWPEDINGDGLILRMRVPDPNGEWFAPEDVPKLLVPRLPGDKAGRRYRRTVEGLIHDWDGGPWEDPAATTLDFNRNWAAHWRPRHEQPGAGRYPFSEPEVRAVADFAFDHHNIFGIFGLHNGTNAILRPPTAGADSDMDPADLLVFRQLADLGSRMTGFPAKAIHEYRMNLAAPHLLYGTFTEWGYRHCGLFAMEIEFGNLYNSVGYDTKKNFSLGPEEQRKRERDALAWHEAHPEAGVFADWKPFDHPQLGPVEIGGWTPIGSSNPVAGERVAIWEKARQFIFELASRAPRLDISGVSVEPLGEQLFRVSCRVANDGYLPTHVTTIGAGFSHVDGVRVEVERTGNIEFIAGRSRTELGHLKASEFRALQWVLRCSGEATITLLAHAPRAGSARTRMNLQD